MSRPGLTGSFIGETQMTYCDNTESQEDTPSREEAGSRLADLSSALRGFRQRLATFGLGEAPDPLLDEVVRADGPNRDL